VRGPDRDRQSGSDDAVRPEDAQARIGHVHRPAATATGAGVLAHQLGEHRPRRQPLGQHVTVAAVRRGDHVVRPGVVERADRAGLLPDRGVHEARDQTVAVEDGDALLHAADHGHAPVRIEQLVAVHEVLSGR
jgi:hypothetical protein